MKVGKEEIVGVLAAFEWSSKRDYKADCKLWESRLQHIVDELATVPGVRTQIYYRTVGNEVPYLALTWDERRFDFTAQDCLDALRAGDPQIEVMGGMYREIVQNRCRAAVQREPAPERASTIAGDRLQYVETG